MSDLTVGQIDAWLVALREASEPSPENPEGAMTANELSEKWAAPITTTRKRIGLLLKQGKAEVVTVKRTRIDQRVQNVPAYRLVA